MKTRMWVLIVLLVISIIGGCDEDAAWNNTATGQADGKAVVSPEPEPPVTIPEPAILTLVAIGTGLVGWCRRRKMF